MMRFCIIKIVTLLFPVLLSQGILAQYIDTLYFGPDRTSLDAQTLISLHKHSSIKDGFIIESNDSICNDQLRITENCIFLRRAETVRDYLASHGVDSNVIVIETSAGKSKKFKESGDVLLVISNQERLDQKVAYADISKILE